MPKDKSIISTNRRSFLKTVTHAGLSMGFMRTSSLAAGMMLGRSAIGANADGDCRRVVCVYIPGGAPTQGGRSQFIPSANLTLPDASAPLETVKDECVFFSDATVSGGGGHGFTSKTLGAAVQANTYDVELERTLGASSPFPSLLLGVESTVGNHGSATRANFTEVNYEDNPIAAFNRLFGGNINVSSIGTQRAQSALDVQKAEIMELRRALGVEEQQRLDEHLNSLQTIENRLQAQASQDGVAGCSNPVWNATNFDFNPNDRSSFNVISELQIDLSVLALRCNLTPVVSIMLGNHQSDHSVPELNYTDTYHQSIHGGQAGSHLETRAYLSGRMEYLIDQLRSTTDEFGNPLLDSTLVVQVTDMGDGNAHTSDEAPMFLAGGGSRINRGQLAQCGQHVNIFDTMTEVLGLTGQVPQYGSGPLNSVIS